MLAGRVLIRAVKGALHCVAYDPPIDGRPVSNFETSYSAAVGHAVDVAVSFERSIVDETGRLSDHELKLLCMGYAIDELPKAIAELAIATEQLS